MSFDITRELSFLVDFCIAAVRDVFGLFGGVTLIIGFILIWKVIDNFVPKG